MSNNKLGNDAKEIADFLFQKLNQKLTQIETCSTNQKKTLESLKQELTKMDKDLKSSTEEELTTSDVAQNDSISANLKLYILNKYLNPKPVEQIEEKALDVETPVEQIEPKPLADETEEIKEDPMEIKEEEEDLEINSNSHDLPPVRETVSPSLEKDNSSSPRNHVKAKSSLGKYSTDKKLVNILKPTIIPDRLLAKPRQFNSLTPKVSSIPIPTPKGKDIPSKTNKLSSGTPRGVKSISKARNLSTTEYAPINKTFCNEPNDQSTQIGERSEAAQSTNEVI